jgi:hypothetical protein
VRRRVQRVGEGTAAVVPGPISISWWLENVANRASAPAANAPSSQPARISMGTPEDSIACGNLLDRQPDVDGDPDAVADRHVQRLDTARSVDGHAVDTGT